MFEGNRIQPETLRAPSGRDEQGMERPDAGVGGGGSPGMAIAINGKFLSAPVTGVHRVAIELANALSRLKRAGHEAVAGLDLDVVMPWDGIDHADEVDLPKRIMGPLRHIPWEQFTLPLKERSALLLNLCNIGPAFRSRSVTMIHDAQVYLTPGSYSLPFRAWYKLVQPVIVRRHRHILTVSDYSRQQIRRFCRVPEDRISVVHNGVDHVHRHASNPAILDRLGLHGARFVIGLATTQLHKNVATLIDAFRGPALADLRLVLFGSAGRAAFEATGMAVPDNVVFAGRVTDGELKALMSAALATGFPSRTEGFGLPPLEAMALGCPAVVAPCGALPEICGDAAIYADPDRPEEWRAAFRSLADDAGRHAALSIDGTIRASHFTWDRAALELCRIMRTVLAADAPGQRPPWVRETAHGPAGEASDL